MSKIFTHTHMFVINNFIWIKNTFVLFNLLKIYNSLGYFLNKN